MTYVLSDHTWGSRDHPQGMGKDLQGAAPPRDNFRVGLFSVFSATILVRQICLRQESFTEHIGKNYKLN